jgi:NADPH-dependent 2,4-dienoyl-CoA reductase/sulfur reductase-like enzyme
MYSFNSYIQIFIVVSLDEIIIIRIYRKMTETINSDNKSNKRKILIIGGVAAGTSAASKARRIDPMADIKIIQEEPLVSYGSCGIPYVLEGLIDGFDKLIARSLEDFKNKHHIDILINTVATRIDPSNNQLSIKNVHSKKEKVFDYDSLVIATGARAIVPEIRGLDEANKAASIRNLFFLRNFEDGINIEKELKNKKSAIIVGSGLIGIEMTQAFKKRGLNVTLIERADHVLANILDNDMAKMIEEELKYNEINIILNEKVEEIILSSPNDSFNLDNKLFAIGIKTNKREIFADCILLGVGVKPNSEIAKDAGIELGYQNAIKVDDFMRTNISNIFAAGDCATARNYITNKDDYLPLGTTANKQGRIAGENAAATDSNTKFEGIAGCAITKTFGLFAAKTGLNIKEALENGFDAIENKIEDVTRAGYYPDNKPIWIKLVADRKSKRILGAQIVGEEGVKGRIDLISFALLKKATIEDLANYDSCYVPPVSPVWEPLNIAALQIIKLFI